MVKNVYRCYLYVVYLALVIFAATGLGRLLQVLFDRIAFFHGNSGGMASSQDLVQALVFALVSWVIAGSLGGLHFWLIRRDMRTDPVAAKGGAVRAFFLNATLAWIVGTTVPIAAYALFPLLGNDGNVSAQLAFVLAALAVLVLLEWDRQRYPAESSVALVFQRLHFYGLQLFLLGFFIATWFAFASAFLLFVSTSLLHLTISGPNCGGVCTVVNGGDVLRALGSVVWVTAFWLGYGWLTRKDIASLLRQLAHFLSLAIGFGLCIEALYQVFELVLQAIIGQQVALSEVLVLSGDHYFIGPLTAGLLVLAVYSYWMRYVVRSGAIQRSTVLLIGETLLTISLAAAFWWGVGLLLYNAMELWFAAAKISTTTWVSAWALMLSGVAYLPLDFHLYRRTLQSEVSGPRRGLLFALMGSGTVALAIGASVALFAVGTSALGSPLQDWQQVARSGLAAFLVGAVVVGFYLWRFRKEFPADTAKKPVDGTPGPSAPAAQHADQPGVPVVSTAGAPSEGTSIMTAPTEPLSASKLVATTPDEVLDALLTGKIDRADALARLQKLFVAAAPVSGGPDSPPRPQMSPAEMIVPELPKSSEEANK